MFWKRKSQPKPETPSKPAQETNVQPAGPSIALDQLEMESVAQQLAEIKARKSSAPHPDTPQSETKRPS